MKKVLSILLAICMVLATVPMMSVTIFAADEHTHCICGNGKNVGDHTSHSAITYTAWTSTTSLPAASGNYYLTDDVTVSSSITLYNSDINLCLNGHTVYVTATYVYSISYKANLTITDCSDGNGKFSCTGTDSSCYVLKSNGFSKTYDATYVQLFNTSFENGKGQNGEGGIIYFMNGNSNNKLPYLLIYGCNFTNNVVTSSGGVIRFYRGMNGTDEFRIYNSNFVGNKATNAGVLSASWSSVLIDGCTFVNNTATSTSTSNGASTLYIGGANSEYTNSATIRNSTFTGNTTAGGYGTVYLGLADNNISGITMTGNTSSSTGSEATGGIYVEKNLTVSGTNVITGNTANSIERNLYLYTRNTFSGKAENLSSDSKIGVSFYSNKYLSSTQTLFTADEEGYAPCFTSDLSALKIKEDDSNTILAYRPAEVTGVSVAPSGTVPTTDKAGETVQMKATVSPANAEDDSVTWTSSNPAVATVSDTGLVTVVAAGTTKITATSVSNTSKSSSYTLTFNHSFTNYVSNNDATCTADGTKTAKCDNCDATDKITDEGSKLGHSFTTYTYNNDATCTEDGTKTAKCDRCDATDKVTAEGTALGHSFTNYVSNNDATCTADGTKTAKCDRCDATDTIADEGTALGHSFTNYVSDGNATCTADGTKTAECDRCDATDTIADEGTALGHSFTAYVYNNDATCTKDGTETAKCDRCDVTDTRTVSGTALGHIDEDGNYACDRCGADMTPGCHWCAMKAQTTSILHLLYSVVDWIYHTLGVFSNMFD